MADEIGDRARDALKTITRNGDFSLCAEDLTRALDDRDRLRKWIQALAGELGIDMQDLTVHAICMELRHWTEADEIALARAGQEKNDD